MALTHQKTRCDWLRCWDHLIRTRFNKDKYAVVTEFSNLTVKIQFMTLRRYLLSIHTVLSLPLWRTTVSRCSTISRRRKENYQHTTGVVALGTCSKHVKIQCTIDKITDIQGWIIKSWTERFSGRIRTAHIYNKIVPSIIGGCKKN